MKTKRQWYDITNKADDKTAEILIYGSIGKSKWDDDAVGAKDFIQDLAKLGDIENILIRLNSPGGSVFDGNAIYNALTTHKAFITVHIDGVAASIASVIAMAGNRVHMPENAMMMIHDPMWGMWGNEDELRKMADTLGKVKVGLVSSYAKKTGMAVDDIGELMKAETWMTAKEAVETGFADVAEDAIDIQNNFDLSGFRNTPECFKNTAPCATTINPVGKTDTHHEAKTMPTNTATPPAQPDINLDYLIKNHADLVAVIRKQGAKAEQQRIQDVEAQLLPGHENLIAKLKTDGLTTGPEAAVQVLAAERTAGKTTLNHLQNEAPPQVPPSFEAPTNKVDPNAPIEERCKAEWDSNPGIRAEFGKFETFQAYKKADEKNLIKTLKK